MQLEPQARYILSNPVGGGCKIRTVMGKKKFVFDPHLIFPNILRRHEIFYDKVAMGPKFLPPNYGARI